ncbi:MAG TPA: endolytic transglycosylase MltG [Bacteroidales bacterium]|nr:endolytic transglycosylase MltG [Bacteroidales bacterium]
MRKKRNSGSGKKFLLLYLLVVIAVTVFGTYFAYDKYTGIFSPNVVIDKSENYIYIPTGASFELVVDHLVEQKYIRDRESFEWVAEKKKYKGNIKPGRFKIKANMSNNELVNLLRSGKQDPVKVSFNNIKSKEALAGALTRNLEADSVNLLRMLNNRTVAEKYGFTTTTILTMFIPNTYEFYWNTSEEKLLERMAKEYKKFWTDERRQLAADMGLTQTEVYVLASIVQAEQNQHDTEKPLIAGLYLNRIRIGMPLQSDPTVKFATGLHDAKRILAADKDIDSPYNTYKYKGLPPGPINLPEVSSIDAVLNYKKNNNVYMCAKEDLSGFHYFTNDFKQHLIYAEKYQKALNKMGIMR